jgi:hypothetical protein
MSTTDMDAQGSQSTAHPPEVSEQAAKGKVKAVYEDIQATFGSQSVGPVFRRLGTIPWFLQLTWRHLKPNATIVYFEASAVGLTRSSIDAARAGISKAAARSVDESVEKVILASADLSSRWLLSLAAIRGGFGGQLPKMNLIPADAKRPIDPPSTKLSIGSTDTSSLFGPLRELGWNDVETPEMTPVVQALNDPSQWPEASSMPASFERIGELQQQAMLSAEALPFRMEMSPSACRQAGLSEDEIEAVRGILDEEWDPTAHRLLRLGALAGSFGIRARAGSQASRSAAATEPAVAAP